MQILYQEKLKSKWITIIFLLFSLIFLFFILYQFFIGPLGNNPAPNWVLIIMFLIFMFLALNFISLVIQVTPEFIIVGYGIFKHRIALDDIEDIYSDKSSFVNYGGWGIRLGRVKGRWRLVYNIPKASQVVLSMKKGIFKEFVFSTENPDELMSIIHEQISI